MKKLLTLGASFWISVFSFAQQTDFTGIWHLDKSRSKLDEKTASVIQSQKITVDQNEKGVTITIATVQPASDGQQRADLGNGSARTYTFDGKEYFDTKQSPIGEVEIGWKAGLRDGLLVLTTKHRFNGNGDVTTNTEEVWTLSGDGTILIIKRKTVAPNGIFHSELVYDRSK